MRSACNVLAQGAVALHGGRDLRIFAHGLLDGGALSRVQLAVGVGHQGVVVKFRHHRLAG